MSDRIPTYRKKTTTTGIYAAVTLSVNPDTVRHELMNKIFDLAQRNRKFKASWQKERADLKDQSISGYHLSLASIACGLGWGDQDIADMLVAFSRKHGEEVKAASYFRRTIAKARATMSGSGKASIPKADLDALDRLTQEVRTEQPERHQKVTELLRVVSKIVGEGTFKIMRGVRYEADPDSAYKLWLETNGGKSVVVDLGCCKGLTNQQLFGTRIFEETGHTPKKFKSGWDKVSGALWACCEQEPIPEATDQGQAQDWLEGYLMAKKPGDDSESAIRAKNPWCEKSSDEVTIFFFLAGLKKWLKIKSGLNIGLKDLAVILRSYGCKSGKKNIVSNSKKTSCSVWHLDGSIASNIVDKIFSPKKI